MTKIFAMLLLPFMLFGFEISFNKKFEKQISPDKLSTNISITVIKESESEISPELESFNKLISRNDDIEKRAGEFSIRPKYNYHKGQSTIVGYHGILRYQVYTTNSKDMNRFIKSLLKLKDDEDISVTVSGLNWIVSQNKKDKVIDELRLESIIWSKKYASEISKKINSTCKTKEIRISSIGVNPMYRNNKSDMMMLSSEKQRSNIPVPQANKNSLSINPIYVLECK